MIVSEKSADGAEHIYTLDKEAVLNMFVRFVEQTTGAALHRNNYEAKLEFKSDTVVIRVRPT